MNYECDDHMQDKDFASISMAWSELYSSVSYLDEDERFHRLDGPAHIIYLNSGMVLTQSWYRHGREHRDDGPSFITVNRAYKFRLEQYRMNDILHSLKCPASITIDTISNQITDYSWHVNGQEINPKDCPVDLTKWPLSEEEQIMLRMSIRN